MTGNAIGATTIRRGSRLGGGLGPAFWRLWAGSAISNLADGMFRVGLPLLAVSLTDSPALVAGVAVAARLPWLVFALLAGALADRVDRRHAMIFVEFGRVVLLAGLALAVLTGAVSIVVVYVVAFALGVLETIFDTAAQSILPNVVGRDRVTAGNARLHAAEQTMNEFLGPSVGGFVAAMGLGIAFGATAAGYLGAGLLLLGLHGSFRADRRGVPERIDREILEGLAYVYRDALLRTLVIVVAGINLANGAVWAIFVLYAVEPGPMGLSGIGFGLLLTVGAVGSIAGTIVASSVERRIGRANVLALTIVSTALQYGVFALTAEPAIVGSALVAGNVVLSTFNVVFISLRQRIVPDRLLGRLIASFRVVSWGTVPVGALLGGVVGAGFGLPAVFASAALLIAVLLPARVVVTDMAIREAELAADDEEPFEVPQPPPVPA